MRTATRALLVALASIALHGLAGAQEEAKSIPKAPPRAEGEGPWKRLILRGVTVIDGTGAPPYGPGRRRGRGEPHRAREARRQPGCRASIPTSGRRRRRGTSEIDLAGHYLLPGFVDMHGHVGGADQGTPAEYVFKLWMGHGITTVRDPGQRQRPRLDDRGASEKSARNEITAPRLFAYVFFGLGSKTPLATPEAGARVGGEPRRRTARTASSSWACGPTC